MEDPLVAGALLCCHFSLRFVRSPGQARAEPQDVEAQQFQEVKPTTSGDADIAWKLYGKIILLARQQGIPTESFDTCVVPAHTAIFDAAALSTDSHDVKIHVQVLKNVEKARLAASTNSSDPDVDTVGFGGEGRRACLPLLQI